MDIKEIISKYLQTHDTVNILISGCTCSGKTTLAKEIQDYFSDKYSVTIVAQDDYFKNLPDIPRVREGYLTDSINAFHTEEFKYDVEMLFIYGYVKMPIYDIATNTRISKDKKVVLGRINIFEGLYTIDILSGLNNCISIFIDTDIDICLKRRIERDTSKFGIPEARILQYWKDCISPISKRWIFSQKALADIVIKGDEIHDS